MQPHRYTRLSSLFDQFATCFNDADAVIVAPTSMRPASSRSRAPTATALVPGLKAHGHRHAHARSSARTNSPASSSGLAQPGDYVVFLGAGTITQWAYALPGELAALDEKAA